MLYRIYLILYLTICYDILVYYVPCLSKIPYINIPYTISYQITTN